MSDIVGKVEDGKVKKPDRWNERAHSDHIAYFRMTATKVTDGELERILQSSVRNSPEKQAAAGEVLAERYAETVEVFHAEDHEDFLRLFRINSVLYDDAYLEGVSQRVINPASTLAAKIVRNERRALGVWTLDGVPVEEYGTNIPGFIEATPGHVPFDDRSGTCLPIIAEQSMDEKVAATRQKMKLAKEKADYDKKPESVKDALWKYPPIK